MNYDRFILELLNRVAALEDEIDNLKSEITEVKKNMYNIDDNANIESKQNSIINSFGGRDATKYIFNGRIYCKNRLVLAVVKKFVEENPDVTAEELLIIFDKTLQGSLGVVQLANVAKMNYSDYSIRFFASDDEIIHTATGDCYVCSQWSKYNINGFITRAKQLNIDIQVAPNN